MIRQALMATAILVSAFAGSAMAQDSNSTNQNMGGSTGCTNEGTTGTTGTTGSTASGDASGTATGDCALNTNPESGGTGVDSAPGVTGSSTPPTNQNGQDVPADTGTTGTTTGTIQGTGSGSDVTPSN